MKKISLVILLLTIISCGKKDQQSLLANIEAMNSVAHLIECQSIDTNLVIAEDECGQVGLTNTRMFIFDYDKAENKDLFKSEDNETYLNLNIKLDESILEGHFQLVSKFGKVISNRAVYSRGNGDLRFYELEKDDFKAHDIFMVTKELFFEGGNKVTLKNAEGRGCVTGRVDLVDLEDLVQPEGCEGLRVEKIYTGATIQVPTFYENKESGPVQRYIRRRVISMPADGKLFSIETVASEYQVKIKTGTFEEATDYEKFFDIETNKVIESSRNICMEVGILSYTDRNIHNGTWFKVTDEEVKLVARGEVVVQGEKLDALKDYKKYECYDLNPKPIGYALIKE